MRVGRLTIPGIQASRNFTAAKPLPGGQWTVDSGQWTVDSGRVSEHGPLRQDAVVLRMVHRPAPPRHSGHKLSPAMGGGVGGPQPVPAPLVYQPDGNLPVCQCSAFLDPYPSPQTHWR
jgi:hypothetical protein